MWPDCAKRIPSLATFRAARTGVSAPSVVETGTRAETLMTTEGTETRLHGARKDDGEGGTSCHSSTSRPQIQDHPLRVGELWLDCAERIPSSAAFRAARMGVLVPSVVEKGIRAEAPSTTEGAETRLRGARKDDGEEMNFVPFISTPPADLGLSIEGGRVVARLCGVDTFVGRFPCRLDGRFRAFGGEVQNTRRRGLWYTPRMRNIIFPMSGMLSIQMHRAWSF